ncbi:universal stress protein [Amycolatopsis pigmentata]|uniref:Universal stress protein n=1 Tax=Amycolatopsis pigmentata TaxID=450801 RepID=A0ABW5FSB8_9PSEU
MHVSAGGPPIVVGVDGSRQALDAVTWGAREAVRWNAPLVLLHAYEVPESGPRPGPSASDWIAARKQAADQLLRESMAVAERVRPRADITVESVVDSSIPLLLRRSHTAKMVVLGSRGHSAFADLLAGSTATALAAHGHCPVTVIRGSDPNGRADAPVVAGVDGSALSEPALELAFQEASVRGVHLIASHSWHDLDLAETFGAARGTLEVESPGGAAERLLAECLAGWQEKYPEVTVERVLAEDRPRDHLLDRSRTAQLVVAGSRGRGGFQGLLLGSTSHALIHHADCPVLIARSPLPAPRA